jgi:hypothetical protein
MLPSFVTLASLQADPDTLGIGALVAGILILEMRLLRRKLDIVLPALFERNRRRDSRRRKRESMHPHVIRRSPSQPVVADEWPEEESTDLHELMELERVQARARRDTDRRRGERPPRPGTHHDREE